MLDSEYLRPSAASVVGNELAMPVVVQGGAVMAHVP